MKKRSNELSKRLLEEGEKMNREEFNELVKKSVFKDTEEGNKCPLLILDYDEIIGDSSQEIDDNLMDYVSNLRQRINYTNKNINDVNDLVEGLQKAKEK